MAEVQCEKCSREFSSKEALEMHSLAKHSVEGLSKEDRHEVREKTTEEQRQKKKRNKTLKNTVIAVIVLAALGIFGWWLSTLEFSGGTYSNGHVHWHAALLLEVCGEPRDLPAEVGSGLAHGQGMAGTPLMHHHHDGTIHIEGIIQKPEDIALGKFTDSIGLAFDSDTLMEKTNGDECSPGEPGQVKMSVNGVPNTDFRNYVLKATENAREQVIRLVFG